jgi:cyanophycinase
MLALVGSGEYLPPMVVVDKYLLGQLKTEVRVICLPTAAGTEGAERISYWMELGKAHFSKLGVSVEALPVIDEPSANDAKYAKQIRQANFIYLSGGKPDYLFRTLSGSLVWTAIMEVLELGGLVAGCSAGVMIMGERIPGFPHSSPGFGLLKGTIIMPHFDEIPKAMVHTLHLMIGDGQTLLGIEGNTALVGENDDWQVVGIGGVMVWNQLVKNRYVNGDQVRWK